MARAKTIAVRLEGGLGDHILGMRLLYFIRRRFPGHGIIGYSDASGGRAQAEIARMSPFLSEVIPVYHKGRYPTVSTWGSLDNIDGKYLRMMRRADLFFDAWGQNYFLDASRILDTPFHEIMARRPELSVPPESRKAAAGVLRRHPGGKFVGIDISKYDLATLKKHRKTIVGFIRWLLKDPDVVIFNFYLSEYKFGHWPRALGMERELQTARESIASGELWNVDRRVIPMVDLPIATLAAILERCRYFLGVDNGIKHLAWALGVPHTFFEPGRPSSSFIWRWMPDFHRMLTLGRSAEEMAEHLAYARGCLNRPSSRRRRQE